jgi:hypothetical protein
LPEYEHELPSEPITPPMLFVQPATITANNSGNTVHLNAAPLVVGAPLLGAPDLTITG